MLNKGLDATQKLFLPTDPEYLFGNRALSKSLLFMTECSTMVPEHSKGFKKYKL